MSTDLREIAGEIAQTLDNPAVTSCANRRGLRRQTGDLLETHFVDFAAALGPDLSVEIGAHEASYSRWLKAASPRTTVLAFEANPHVYDRHASELGSAGLEYINLAICAGHGPVTLQVPRRTPKGAIAQANRISSLNRRSAGEFSCEVITVPGTTLDQAVEAHQFDSAVAWIDVEGAQRDVLAGATSFLRRTAALYIEVENREIWQGQLIGDEVIAALGAYGLEPVMQDGLARAQFNIVLANPQLCPSGAPQRAAEAYLSALRTLLP